MTPEAGYSVRETTRPPARGPILVAMPVFNEAATLGPALRATRRYCDGGFLGVDDGSTDESSLILADETRGPTLSTSKNRGYGSAIRAALAYADRWGYEYLLTLDADLQHDPKLVPAFLELAGRADLVSGSRYLRSSPTLSAVPRFRAVGNAFYRELVEVHLGLRLSDIWCGMKLYRVAAFRGLAQRATGYEFPLELWAYVAARRLSVLEAAVPLVYYARDFERDRDPDALRRLGTLFFRTFVASLERVGLADRRQIADLALRLVRDGAFDLTGAEVTLIEGIVVQVTDQASAGGVDR